MSLNDKLQAPSLMRTSGLLVPLRINVPSLQRVSHQVRGEIRSTAFEGDDKYKDHPEITPTQLEVSLFPFSCYHLSYFYSFLLLCSLSFSNSQASLTDLTNYIHDGCVEIVSQHVFSSIDFQRREQHSL